MKRGRKPNTKKYRKRMHYCAFCGCRFEAETNESIKFCMPGHRTAHALQLNRRPIVMNPLYPKYQRGL